MKSKLKTLLGALAIIVASVIGTASTAQSSGGIGKTMAQEAIVQRMPQLPTEDDTRIISLGEDYRGIFALQGATNPFPGRTYRNITAADFQNRPRMHDVFVISLLFIFHFDLYNVLDDSKPALMNRSQFLHVLLREAARRDVFLNSSGYIPLSWDGIPQLTRPFALFVSNEDSFVPRSMTNRAVTISRPLDVPAEQRLTATITAGEAVYRDVAITLLQHPRAVGVPMQRDIANQIGFTNGGGALDIETDMEAFIIGYLAGSSPVFFNGRQAGRPAGPLPLTLGFNQNYSEAQVREAFCAVVPAITNPGRARGVDQNMAVSAGFLMARHDARDNFASNDVRLGANGVLCPATPPVWNHTVMGPAITGIDLLPEQANTRR